MKIDQETLNLYNLIYFVCDLKSLDKLFDENNLKKVSSIDDILSYTRTTNINKVLNGGDNINPDYLFLEVSPKSDFESIKSHILSSRVKNVLLYTLSNTELSWNRGVMGGVMVSDLVIVGTDETFRIEKDRYGRI